MEFITLTRKDAEFSSYLLGTFAKDQRAIPVETFDGHQSGERVTFRLERVDKIAIPSWWRVYLSSCRPELLALTLGPVLAAWLSHPGSWPPLVALLGIFFLHTAAFLFNDFQDHVRGVDRLNRNRGSQVIQKGWVTAADLKKWAVVNSLLALALGVPAVMKAPVILTGILLAAGFALLILARSWGLRYGVCDLAVWALFGPLLTAGTAVASLQTFTAADLALGTALGALTLWVFQSRQFEHLFRSRPEMFRTGLAYLPYERARWFIIIEAAGILVLQVSAAAWLGFSTSYLALAVVAATPFLITLMRLYRASSPLASEFIGFSRMALLSHLALITWWWGGLITLWR